MPSTKKALSQARKANKKARQSANSSDNSCDNAAPSDPCKHIKLPDNCTLEGFKDAHKLWNDFLEKMSDYSRMLVRAFPMEVLARFKIREKFLPVTGTESSRNRNAKKLRFSSGHFGGFMCHR
jgi:hypothetical protein